MKGHSKRRFLFVGLPLAVGVLAAAAVLATGSVSAAPTKGAPPGQGTTIYSETFAPFTLPLDYDSPMLARYAGPNGYGPGYYPNYFVYNTGTGHGAFFNTPDLTFGATPMSAVSAEVCLDFTNTSGSAYVQIVFGVQDKNGLVTYTALPEPLTTTTDGQVCPTLTFDNPVQLVNHPHLVVALDMKLKIDDTAGVEGVTYKLQPTQTGDVTPGSAPPPANVPSWLSR